MIDFVLGLALAAMLVRGWTRGFVRESLDLVGLVLGAWIAFRLSAPFGGYLTTSFDISPEVARIGGGILLFVLFGVLLSIAAHYLSRVMNLPGLSMVNRVGGAVVAVGWSVVILLVLFSVASVLPLPDGWRSSIDDSNVVQAIAGEDAVPKELFESLAGDNVMSAMSAIRDVFGTSRAVPVGSETFAFPAAVADEIRQVRDEADAVLRAVNEHRVGVEARAITPIDAIMSLAEDHAAGLYRAGLLRRMGDCVANLAQRSHQVLRCDNGVALAGTSIGGFDGILETVSGRAMVENPDLDRGGVAVVDGPTGRLVVIVLAG
jgi:membrane protein required for colicin V production